MNWWGIATVVLGYVAFDFGRRWAQQNPGRRLLAWCAALVLALPAVCYAAYYSKLLGEPLWLYRVRTVPGSELLAAPAGFIGSLLHVHLIPRLHLSRWGNRFLVPIALGLGLAIPYLKPILRPLRTDGLQTKSQNGIWLQSTLSTCGPAAAATILSQFGLSATERDLAKESFTCSSGTEIWYLARAMREHGMITTFVLGDPSDVPLPAIAGVRLKSADNAGHFVALLRHSAGQFIVEDPLEGCFTNNLAELKERYDFTGFLLLVKPQAATTKKSLGS